MSLADLRTLRLGLPTDHRCLGVALRQSAQFGGLSATAIRGEDVLVLWWVFHAIDQVDINIFAVNCFCPNGG